MCQLLRVVSGVDFAVILYYRFWAARQRSCAFYERSVSAMLSKNVLVQQKQRVSAGSVAQ
jgi:hypothetical protein